MSLSSRICEYCGTMNVADARFCPKCGRLQSNSSPNAGPLRNGRYRLLKSLGQGGMGSVYQAEDVYANNALRAVKIMRQDGLRQPELKIAIKAFKQEAMLLTNLVHPNLPRIYDFFEEDGYWYFVMDYIDGQTLLSYLKANGGKLLVKDVFVIGIQLCTVLGSLHSQHPPIIFRDLKPSNVMITKENHIYLIDFGIARLFKPGQTKDTHNWGTDGYAAPEQYGTMQTDARTDIFALGVILHQLLSGHNPTTEPFHFPPLNLRKQSPIAPLEPLIMSMVDISRDNRPASMLKIKYELLTIYDQLDKQAKDFLPKRYIHHMS